MNGSAISTENLDDVRRLLLVAFLCNDAIVEYDDEHRWHIHGDPSEGAISLAAIGLDGVARTATRYPARFDQGVHVDYAHDAHEAPNTGWRDVDGDEGRV